jgi:hypothetical protein
MPTRVVAPLVPISALLGIENVHPRVAPLLIVTGRPYRLNPLDLATLGVQRLVDYVSSFAEDDESKRSIQDALDVALKPY